MPPQTTSLYHTDYQLWLEQTIAQLKVQDFHNLDLENLIEEIISLSKRDKRAILSYLMRLCEHLLKLQYWEVEKEYSRRGWIIEINNFRTEIQLILQDSPSLKTFFREALPECYQKARKNILRTTATPPDLIPQTPPFTPEQLLDEDWLP